MGTQPMTAAEFVRGWVEETSPDVFRYAVISLDISPQNWDSDHSKISRKKIRLNIDRDQRVASLRRRIVESLKSARLTFEEANQLVAQENLGEYIKIYRDPDSLTNGIIEVMEKGGNVWDNDGKFAWEAGGFFVVHFWHDPSHPRLI